MKKEPWLDFTLMASSVNPDLTMAATMCLWNRAQECMATGPWLEYHEGMELEKADYLCHIVNRLRTEGNPWTDGFQVIELPQRLPFPLGWTVAHYAQIRRPE